MNITNNWTHLTAGKNGSMARWTDDGKRLLISTPGAKTVSLEWLEVARLFAGLKCMA